MDIREKGLQLLVTRKNRFECLNDKTLVDYSPGNGKRFSCLFVILLGTEEVQNLERIPISLAFIQGQKTHIPGFANLAFARRVDHSEYKQILTQGNSALS